MFSVTRSGVRRVHRARAVLSGPQSLASRAGSLRCFAPVERQPEGWGISPPRRTFVGVSRPRRSEKKQSAPIKEEKEEKAEVEVDREEDYEDDEEDWEDAAYKAQRKRERNRLLFMLGTSVTILAIVIGLQIKMRHDEDVVQTFTQTQVQRSSTPAIGAPWKLLNEHGETVTSEDFHGKYTLLYFGFTHCPDICPAALKKMAVALDMLPSELRDQIQSFYISVDPRRDTPKRIGEWRRMPQTKDYDPNIIVLTGTNEMVNKICKDFRVYHMPEETADESDEYQVDHSVFFYLMDRNGVFLEPFGPSMVSKEYAAKLTEVMSQDAQRE